MEFDVKSRIKDYAVTIKTALKHDNLSDYGSVLCDGLGVVGCNKLVDICENGRKISEQDYEEIKQSCFTAQEEKTRPWFGNDAYFFEDMDDDEFQSGIKAALEGDAIHYQIDMEEYMTQLLRGATVEAYFDNKGKEVKIKGTPLESRQKDLRRVMEKVVKEGYNIYPMMRRINAEYERLTKEENDTEKKYHSKLICSKSQMLMERVESVSPYKPIFTMSEKLGQLLEEEKKLQKEKKYEQADELQEAIAKQKELLRKRIESSGFDLDELAFAAQSKREYVKESEKGFDFQSPNYAMFVGLQETKKLAQMIKHQQAQKNQL